MFAPTVTRVHVGDIRCAEVVPQGTFSCGFAAIHLAAPYRMITRCDHFLAMYTHRGECGFFVHIEQNDIIM